MGIYVFNSYFIQHVLGICNFAWNSPYKDHTRERQQIRGLSAPFLSSKLTREELKSTSFNISLQEGHSLIFADHTEIIFTMSCFTAMLLSTICTLKMCNIFHFQIQSDIETLPLSHLSPPLLPKPDSEVGQRGGKNPTPQPPAPPPSIYFKFIEAYLKQINFLRYIKFWLDRVLGNLL